jgi:hypothetical protein
MHARAPPALPESIAMDTVRFDAMVQRLERENARAPRTYFVKVALLAALGFGILALLVGIATSGLLLLVGIALAMVLKGGAMWLWLLKLGKLGLLLAIPLWLLVKSSVQALFARLPKPQGREIARGSAGAVRGARRHAAPPEGPALSPRADR